MENVQYVYTYGMDDEEVGEFLRTNRTGVLSLADGDVAYAVPVSYAYEDGRLLFRLGDDGDARKVAFAEVTEEACFIVYDEADDESWSVLAQGSLRELPEDDERGDAAAINRAYLPIRVFDEDVAGVDLRLFEFEIESLTGRRTARAEPDDAETPEEPEERNG